VAPPPEYVDTCVALKLHSLHPVPIVFSLEEMKDWKIIKEEQDQLLKELFRSAGGNFRQLHQYSYKYIGTCRIAFADRIRMWYHKAKEKLEEVMRWSTRRHNIDHNRWVNIFMYHRTKDKIYHPMKLKKIPLSVLERLEETHPKKNKKKEKKYN